MSKQDQAKKETHVMSNPNTGEVRVITQEDWDKDNAAYLAGGFVRPDGITDPRQSQR